ncbi:hypothetical protein MSAN_00927900 [Mycena sanguinolenta]|uniref:Uncharacterized protein n=1 Tax=Mycena sanguinolenta TaxID=230812 RepID=A0A8H6YUP6_9AGAR|nr:hypothetical protein MSAN_00927900 [Mycena sanguinolenta]
MTGIVISGDLFSLTRLNYLLRPSASRTKHATLLHRFQSYSRADESIRVEKCGKMAGTWVPLKYLSFCMGDVGVEKETQEKILRDLSDLPLQEEKYRKPSSAEVSVTPTAVGVFDEPAAADIQAEPSVADDDETMPESLRELRGQEKTLQTALHERREEYRFELKVHEKVLQRARKEYEYDETALQNKLHKVRDAYAQEEAELKARSEEAQENARQDAVQPGRGGVRV